MKVRAYLRLMRFHKPAGIVLLWIPTACALWVANRGTPPFNVLFYFFLGTVVMRSAGCVVNDIADRHIDKHVSRTQNRPLTTGEVSLPSALVLLLGLCSIALFIVIQLPRVCFYYALASLFITVLYPVCKRFFAAPQMVLGVAFSMGIPMAYAASHVPIDVITMWLVLINGAWILGYDTMYAMADKADDLRIGVRSTAVFFGEWARLAILIAQMVSHGLWLVVAVSLSYSVWFYVLWGIAALVLVYQQRLLLQQRPDACLHAFSTNQYYGFLLWGALMVAYGRF